jgi:hypothetical protein
MAMLLGNTVEYPHLSIISTRAAKSITSKRYSNSWIVEISSIKIMRAINLQSPIPTPQNENIPRVKKTTSKKITLGIPLITNIAAT